MKMTMTMLDGTPDEIIYVHQKLMRESAPAIAPAPIASQQAESRDGVLYPSIEAARQFLKRRRLSKDQLTFFRMLYKAHPTKVHAHDLRKAMNHSKPNEFTGVLGALGRRFANTLGVQDGQEFMTWQDNERGTSYGLPDSVR